MKNAVNRALAAKKQYTQPRMEQISVQLITTLLGASGISPRVIGGDEQVNAW
jgi:hypothetical protein